MYLYFLFLLVFADGLTICGVHLVIFAPCVGTGGGAGGTGGGAVGASGTGSAGCEAVRHLKGLLVTLQQNAARK